MATPAILRMDGAAQKDATTMPMKILADLAGGDQPGFSAAWRLRIWRSIVVGFCFGGHATWLAATLPGVDHAASRFYGAGVVQDAARWRRSHPGALLPAGVKERLTCLFGLD